MSPAHKLACMPGNCPTRWSIGLAAWVIQDGNYDNFRTGQRAEFAVEFYAPNGVEDAAGEALGVTPIRDHLYEVTGRVGHCDDGGWVLDFGIVAFHEGTPPAGIRPGAIVRAQLALSVDPFFYFENHASDPAWPDMIYTWDVREIWRETAPFIESDHGRLRDEAKSARISLPRTDAWRDDEGNGDYVFVCDMVAVPPKRGSATAR